MSASISMSDYEFRIFRGRMAQFRVWKNQPKEWGERWGNSIQAMLTRYGNGYLGEFEIFSRYIPFHLPVLEAGCGDGHLVAALKARGYKVEGVDYDQSTINKIHALAPDLSVRIGDVYKLDVPDGYYGGYISMGVFEHNPDGPMDGLRETRRVLARKGVALISVPYLNPARQRRVKNLPTTDNLELTNGHRFYQYYFTRLEFESLLNKAGLKVMEVYPYAVEAGLSRDFTFGRWLEKHRFFHWRIRTLFQRLCGRMPLWGRWQWGHMLLFICCPITE